jgi:hypothetical protein
MDNQEERPEIPASPVIEKLKDNQKQIINKKEHYYDILIEKLHISTLGIDIFIALMIIIAILIVVLNAKK